MNMTIFNACLIASWIIITIGGVAISPGGGLVASGIVLLAITIYVAAKFGV